MNVLTITYIVVMVLGLAWVIYRAICYFRAQRERDSLSRLMFSEDNFKLYLDDLTKRTGGSEDSGPGKPPESSSES